MRRLDFSVSGLGDGDHELRRRERRGTTYTLIAVLASLVVLGRGTIDAPPPEAASTVDATESVAQDPQAVGEPESASRDPQADDESKSVAQDPQAVDEPEPVAQDLKDDLEKPPDPETPPAPTLVITPDLIEFGEQTVKSASTPLLVAIRNDGSSRASLPQIAAMDLQYKSFSVFGTCEGRELAVHEVCEAEVAFIPNEVGEHNATFVILDMKFNRLATAKLHGTGRGTATVEADPVALAFDEFGADRQGLTVTNGGATSLVIHDVSLRGSGGDDQRFRKASDTCRGETIAAGARCAIDIAVQPRDPDLSLDAELVLSHSAPGPDIAIPLSWRAAPVATLRLNPTIFRFGTLDVAQSSSRQVTMTNTGVVPTRIGEPRFDATDMPFHASTDCGQQLRPGATCTLTVVTNPAEPGAFNTTVHIVDSHGRPLADAAVFLDAKRPNIVGWIEDPLARNTRD